MSTTPKRAESVKPSSSGAVKPQWLNYSSLDEPPYPPLFRRPGLPRIERVLGFSLPIDSWRRGLHCNDLCSS